MADSPRLIMPYIDQAQSQKEVTHADALNVLECFVQCVVLDKDRDAPPAATPANGDIYIVAGSGSGAWAGQGGKLAHYVGTAWKYRLPRKGFRAYVSDEDVAYTFDGAVWRAWLGNKAFFQCDDKSANYAISNADGGKIITANISAGSINFRLPAGGFIFNGWAARAKVSAFTASNTCTIRGADNRILRSNDFSNAAWTKNGVTIGTTISGPFAGTTAAKIAEDTSTGTHEISTTYSKGSGITTLSASAYFRGAERTQAILILDDNTSTNRVQARVNTSTGTLAFSNSVGTYTLIGTPVITSVGDGWYRVTLEATVPTGANTTRIMLRLYDGTNTNYTGTSGSGVHAYGAQIAENTPVGDYIETTTAAVRQNIEGAATYVLNAAYQGAGLVWSGSEWLLI